MMDLILDAVQHQNPHWKQTSKSSSFTADDMLEAYLSGKNAATGILKKAFGENIKKAKGYKGSKHKLLKNLVAQFEKSISSDYFRLFDYSQNARYHNYKISQKLALDSMSRLGNIKKYCVKKLNYFN